MVVSWNVLADAYVRRAWFPRADAGLLRAGARTGAVVAVACGFGADVLALQEVDEQVADRLRDALIGYDVRWCPKGRGKPDGCLTAVGPGVRVVGERRLEYADGDPVSGQVAHLVDLDAGGRVLTVANTHVRYDTAAVNQHVGVAETLELLQALPPVAVIAADLNDLPGGPVRAALTGAGFTLAHGDTPTSVFGDGQLRALDVVAVRGAVAVAAPTGIDVVAALPTLVCPSDHVPVAAHVTV